MTTNDSMMSIDLQLKGTDLCADWACPICKEYVGHIDGITFGTIKCEACHTTFELDYSLPIKKVLILGDLVDLPEVRATR